MHVWATVYPYRLHLKISTLLDIMYTYWVSPYFNAVGKKCRIRRGLKLYGNAKCIFIEDDVQIGARCVLEAYTEFQPASQTFTPHFPAVGYPPDAGHGGRRPGSAAYLPPSGTP